MNKIDNLRNDYLVWIDKFDVIADRLINNFSKVRERNDLFLMIEDRPYRDFIMEHYDEACEWMPNLKNLDMDALREEYREYIEDETMWMNERLNIYKDHMELNKAFDKWTKENDLQWKELDILRSERDIKVVEWNDWASNHFINKVMRASIDMTDKDEVNELIADARERLNSVGYTPEKDYYEVHDYLEYLWTINNNFRCDIDDNCMSLLSIDVLENRQLYLPDRESFSMCILKIMEEVDNTFEHVDYWNEHYGEE